MSKSQQECFAGREDRTRDRPHIGGCASDRAIAPGIFFLYQLLIIQIRRLYIGFCSREHGLSFYPPHNIILMTILYEHMVKMQKINTTCIESPLRQSERDCFRFTGDVASLESCHECNDSLGVRQYNRTKLTNRGKVCDTILYDSSTKRNLFHTCFQAETTVSLIELWAYSDSRGRWASVPLCSC